MRSRTFRFGNLLVILAVGAFSAVYFGLAFLNTPNTDAVRATDFIAGRIIDDGIFYNPNTMSVTEIQSHLDRYSANCDMWGEGAIGSGRSINGVAVNPNISRREYARMMREAGRSDYHDAPYVCVSKYYENPTTHKTNFDTAGNVESGMISAAQIIYDAAHKYGINPQVLLVMLKKESYVWSDTWPLKKEYNTVMGYACPDGAPCDSKYFGFYNQTEMAAWQLKYYKEHIYSYGYYPYMTNIILYSPNRSCGSKAVYLENLATTSLYIYTPYTPNDAALAAYPGEAYCGSYGNRNFFMYFSEWFGSTYKVIKNAELADGSYSIRLSSSSSRWIATKDNKAFLSDSIAEWVITKTDKYYTIAEKESGLLLTKSEVGAQISLSEANNSSNQRWIISKNDDSTFTLYSEIDYSVIDTRLAGTSVGTIIQSYNSNNTSAQKWAITAFVSDMQDNQSDDQNNDQEASPIVKDGTYRIASSINQNYVIDISGGATKNTKDGTNIQLWTNNNTDAQLWNISFDANSGFYSIINPVSQKSFDVAQASTTPGANVQLYTRNNTCAQLWKINKTSDGFYIITSSCSELVIDANGAIAKDGVNIHLYKLWGDDNRAQKWALKPVEVGTDQQDNNSLSTNTVYYIASAINRNMVIDISGASKSNMATIQLYKKNNTSAQEWTFIKNSDESYVILNPNSNKVIDIKNGAIASGTGVWLYERNNSCAQRWNVEQLEDKTYAIINSCKNSLVLDLNNGNSANGEQIKIYSRWGDDNRAQKWVLLKK